MMSEVNQKMAGQQSTKERGMYCMSPTHGQGPHVINEHTNVIPDNHQYAEPYTSVPPPRRVTIEEEFRSSSMSQRSSADGTFATIKRNPSRPASRASVSVQGLDIHLSHQMAPPDEKCEYSENSSQSEGSAGKTSSQSSGTRRPLRSH